MLPWRDDTSGVTRRYVTFGNPPTHRCIFHRASQTKLRRTISNNCRRGDENPKSRWVSRERNAGMAPGAVCDWSVARYRKPFFSRRHVQRVDKRHHPTDSLINCEMCCYLLLSYSGAPRNPLCFLPLPVWKVEKQAGHTRIPLAKQINVGMKRSVHNLPHHRCVSSVLTVDLKVKVETLKYLRHCCEC